MEEYVIYLYNVEGTVKMYLENTDDVGPLFTPNPNLARKYYSKEDADDASWELEDLIHRIGYDTLWGGFCSYKHAARGYDYNNIFFKRK